MIQVHKVPDDRLKQGDILKDVEYIENVTTIDGNIEITKILFPLVIVVSQDCDLTWDFENRTNRSASNQDKYLFSAMVLPLYNYEHFIAGTHLEDLGRKMVPISRNQNKSDNKNLRKNETPRYHYLEFADDVPIVNSVIDFKHYFTVNIDYLENHKKQNFICNINDLYRERISQRFTNYLSRIGLPD